MDCLVCRGDLLDDDALTCSACREFAVGRRLHLGHTPPPSWTSTHLEFAAHLARLDALAQAYNISVPQSAVDVPGAWAHFVLAVDAFHAKNYQAALEEARQATILAAPRGWKGFKDHVSVITKASQDALDGQTRSLPRRYRARLTVRLPSVPTDADFKRPEWQCYQQALDHVRAVELEKAYVSILAGLQHLGGPEISEGAAWYLKQFGKAITEARKPRPRFDLKAQPSRVQDVLAVFAHFGLPVPAAEAIEDPAWGALARAWIAFDNGAWQATYAHIDESRFLRHKAPAADELSQQLLMLENKVPAAKRPANYAIRRNGRVHVPGFVKTRKALSRRDGT